MFTIADGREHFFQWDLNRQIIVSDPTIDEVHFCNKTDDCSLVLEVEETEIIYGNKSTIRRYVNVPNILLQDALPIRVYAFCVDYTKVEKIFKVCPRTRPADYVYEETQIAQFSDFTRRADETLDRANEVLDGAEDILVQAQESADSASTSASDALESAAKANESEVNAATSESNAANSVTEALSNANKAKQSEINAQTAALDAVSAKEDTEQLKTDVINLKNETESLKNTTQGFANDASNSAQVATTKANEASESATSASNTANDLYEYVEGHKLEFTHDGNGVVTLEGVELNGLDNYYTKEETDQAIANVEVDLSEYYTKSETDTLLENVDADIVISDDGEGNVIIDTVPGGGNIGPDIDLSDYYTKEEIDNKGYLTSLPEHTHDQYLTELPEHEHSQYLTEHQSLSNYYTKSETYSKTEVDNAIANIPTGGGGSSEGAKDWHWVEVNNISFYLSDSVSDEVHHIKLIIYHRDGTYSSYDFSSNTDMQSLITSYRLPDYASSNKTVNFYYGQVGIDYEVGDIIGYYYWG